MDSDEVKLHRKIVKSSLKSSNSLSNQEEQDVSFSCKLHLVKMNLLHYVAISNNIRTSGKLVTSAVPLTQSSIFPFQIKLY